MRKSNRMKWLGVLEKQMRPHKETFMDYAPSELPPGNAKTRTTAQILPAQSKAASTSGKKRTFGTSLAESIDVPDLTSGYDWQNDQQERLRRFGIKPTAHTAPTTPQTTRTQNRNTYAARQQAEQDEPLITTLPNGEEVFTPKGEAAFLEGFASIYEDEPTTPQATRTQNRDAYDSRVRAAYAERERQNGIFPKAELHPAPAWYLPEKETNDPIMQVGNEYGTKIIDDIFKQGWSGDYGVERVTDPMSPIYNSRYRDAIKDVSMDRAKADYVAGIGAGGELALGAYSNIDEYSAYAGGAQLSAYLLEKTAANVFQKGMAKAMSYAAPIAGIAYTLAIGDVGEAVQTYQNLSKNNPRARQSQSVLDYLEGSDYRYLVDNEKSREKFIQALRGELESLKATERIGYLPYEESETVKQRAVDMLMRIIHLNEQYELYSKKRDAGIREAMKNY
ncbi:MAG: hypothetical protein IJP38_07130 [Oscillospiraceae bacterium]|nr:hypothetical protein [Oscillospiraceae bacterium]